MTVDELPRYVEPTPRVPRACRLCGAFRPEVVVHATHIRPGTRDIVEIPLPLCWICAHDVLVHEASPTGHPRRKHCGCARDAVYPRRVLELRLALAVVDARPPQSTQPPQAEP